MLALLAIVIALLCVAGSTKRLAFAAEAARLDAGVLIEALRGTPAIWPALRAEIAREPGAEWEQELVASLLQRQPALVNEQLNDLDHRAQRWARVPRVGASVASSCGFLIAALVMRDALAAESPDVGAAMAEAINAVVVGLGAAAFCVAAHVRSRAMVREGLTKMDKLVERLEAVC